MRCNILHRRSFDEMRQLTLFLSLYLDDLVPRDRNARPLIALGGIESAGCLKRQKDHPVTKTAVFDGLKYHCRLVLRRFHCARCACGQHPISLIAWVVVGRWKRRGGRGSKSGKSDLTSGSGPAQGTKQALNILWRTWCYLTLLLILLNTSPVSSVVRSNIHILDIRPRCLVMCGAQQSGCGKAAQEPGTLHAVEPTS